MSSDSNPPTTRGGSPRAGAEQRFEGAWPHPRFHLVAPHYPGFGHSDRPDPKSFAYTFDHFAEVHMLDAGHFALDTRADEIAALVRGFMRTQK